MKVTPSVRRKCPLVLKVESYMDAVWSGFSPHQPAFSFLMYNYMYQRETVSTGFSIDILNFLLYGTERG